MGTVITQSIIDDAEKRFYDTTNLRISESEWLGYLNNSQRNLVLINKRVYVKNISILTVAGAKQSIPASDGYMLLDVIRNTGVAGTSSGRMITFLPKYVLSDVSPDWMNAVASTTSEHWTKDEDDDLNFYLYPPRPTTSPGYIEIQYSAIPAEVAIGDPITLRDIYKEPLTLDMLRQAFLAETEVQDLNKSKLYGDQAIVLVSPRSS